MTGKFIVVEGGDGAGKTTFVNLLKECRPELVYSREPGGLDFSEEIRKVILMPKAKTADVLTMFHLFWASRAENTAKHIRPHLNEGRIVISDRFDASTYAYQVGEVPTLAEPFWAMRRLCLSGIVPTYINLNVSPDISKPRLDGRGGKNHFDDRDPDYHRRVQKLYQQFFDNESIKSVTVDANRSQEQVMDCAYAQFCKILES